MASVNRKQDNMSVEQEIIDDAKTLVGASSLKPAHKDSLRDMLTKCHSATNGAQDRLLAIAEAQASMSVCIARDAVHRLDDFAEMIDKALLKHRDDCPMIDKVPTLVIDAMKAEAMREDGAWMGDERRRNDTATVQGRGIKAKADPWTVRIVACCSVAALCVIAYIVKELKGG